MRAMSSHRQAGLTLLELVVSLLILTLLTSVAITSMSGIQEQARYEKTVRQLEQFRVAMLGDSDWNRGIRGYALDLGTLPPNLRVLLVEPTTAAMHWQEVVTFLGPVSLRMGVGWRGPYLVASGSPDDPDTLRDGFGGSRDCNDDGSAECDTSADAQNYGWRFLEGVTLTIKSHGADQVQGPSAACGADRDHKEDCALEIGLNARGIKDPVISVRLLHADADQNPRRLCLRLYHRRVDADADPANNLVALNPITSIALDVVTYMTLTWQFSGLIPAGQNFLAVVSCAGTSDPNPNIYPAGMRPIAVDMRPGSTPPVVFW